jgi:hypothetical protein
MGLRLPKKIPHAKILRKGLFPVRDVSVIDVIPHQPESTGTIDDDGTVDTGHCTGVARLLPLYSHPVPFMYRLFVSYAHSF